MQFKKTKIICTIGPASWDPAMLLKLAQSGMNVARFNMSHGGQEEKTEQIAEIRKISKKLGKPIAVFADLQGPKLRLGVMDGVRQIQKGEKLQLTINPVEDEIPIQFDLSPFVKKDQRIYLNDGLVQLKVLSVSGKVIKCEAQNSGVISSNKGINIPDTDLKKGAFTDKDFRDAEWAIKEDVDFIALSFVQTADDVKVIQDLIKKHKSRAKVIAKIEKPKAMDNIAAIVKTSDVIMVARGDLAIETSAAEVPIFQQKIIRLCRMYQKPVIVATQMLESMTDNPRPTRAEASDVANAVLDQVDVVMLSGETANGKYPIETVKTMKDIILSVEGNPDFRHRIELDWKSIPEDTLAYNSLAYSAAALAFRSRAKALVVTTTSGNSAKFLSSFRPESQIVAVTYDEKISNQLVLVWGVRTIIVDPQADLKAFLKNIVQSLKTNKFVDKNDTIVVVTSTEAGTSGTLDTIKVLTIN